MKTSDEKQPTENSRLLPKISHTKYIKQNNNAIPSIFNLPSGVTDLITTQLDEKTLGRAARVNRQWNPVMNKRELWEKIALEHYPDAVEQIKKHPDPKRLFRNTLIKEGKITNPYTTIKFSARSATNPAYLPTTVGSIMGGGSGVTIIGAATKFATTLSAIAGYTFCGFFGSVVGGALGYYLWKNHECCQNCSKSCCTIPNRVANQIEQASTFINARRTYGDISETIAKPTRSFWLGNT